MKLQVVTAKLKSVLIDLLKGSSKVCVNFYVVGNKLYLQSSSAVTIEKEIDVTVTEFDVHNDISVFLDRTVELLNDAELMTEVRIDGNVLMMVQSNITHSAPKQPELRMDIDRSKIEVNETFPIVKLHSVVRSNRALDEVAKELARPTANVSIVGGYAYIRYETMLYKCKADLPDMQITDEVAKSICKVLSSQGTVKYKFDEETGSVYLKDGSGLIVVAPALTPQYAVAKEFANIAEGLQKVTEINFTRFTEIFNTLCKVYSKRLIGLSVCDGDFRVLVNSGETQLDVGSAKNPIVSLEVSIAQLSAMNKCFKESTAVEVWKGDNVLCLKEKTYGGTLIMAGMLY